MNSRFQLTSFSALAAALLAGGCARPEVVSSATPPGHFFVATNGNDAWSGRQLRVTRADGPFGTLPRALAAAREFRSRTGQAAVIELGTGTYELAAPLVLQPEDSQLEVRAATGAHPVLSGGRKLSGWREKADAGRRLWTAELPEALRGVSFRELWVNGHRAIRARQPNRGYFPVATVPDATTDQPWSTGQTRFTWQQDDLPLLAHPTDAEVLVMTRWVESRLPIAKVDAATRTMLFSKRSIYKLAPGDLWYAEGAREFLDAPGEWYHDPCTGTLCYLPRSDEKLADLEAVIPVLPQLVEFAGAPEAGRFISGVTWRGLTFAHAEWQIPTDAKTAAAAAMTWPAPVHEIGGFGQAAVGVPGAVRGSGVRNCCFERCKFVHLGSYGLELARGCQSNRLSHCELTDLGGGGIKFGETTIRTNLAEQTQANVITDCVVSDGGRMFHSAVGIWIGQSPNNRIEHSRISDFYYTGISIGWTWGYGPALATNNLVTQNHIHHIGVRADGDGPILSDMGGIYTLGMQPGTRITDNIWHDIAGFRYGGWGIYFDEGSSGIVAENNLVHHTTHGGFHQHYGATNVVRNNLFAFARDHQLQRTRNEPHVSFSFSNNIVLFSQGVVLGGSWKNDQYAMDSNLYWDARAVTNATAMKFGDGTFADWQARGHDAHSLLADPGCRAPARGDFRMRADSPAIRIGFRPLDLSQVGPR